MPTPSSSSSWRSSCWGAAERTTQAEPGRPPAARAHARGRSGDPPPHGPRPRGATARLRLARRVPRHVPLEEPAGPAALPAQSALPHPRGLTSRPRGAERAPAHRASPHPARGERARGLRHPYPPPSAALRRAGHPRVANDVQRARRGHQPRRPRLHGGAVASLPGDPPVPRAPPALLRARGRVHALSLPPPSPAWTPLRSTAEAAAVSDRVRLSRLVQVFAWTGLTSLGGGRTAYFYDALVMRRPWITSHEFIQDLTISQLLPGPSFSNLGVALGVRLAGGRGGAWGALAILVPGALILLGLTWLYFHVGFSPKTTSAMHGMGAAVVGLVFVTTGRMIRTGVRDLRGLLMSAAIFLLVGPLHVNTALVIVLVVPVSLWLYRPRSGS